MFKYCRNLGLGNFFFKFRPFRFFLFKSAKVRPQYFGPFCLVRPNNGQLATLTGAKREARREVEAAAVANFAARVAGRGLLAS
jgi:hypothetical protein